jgi:hypothetical protein
VYLHFLELSDTERACAILECGNVNARNHNIAGTGILSALL